MGKNKVADDKSLYNGDFYAEKRSPALWAAAKALYGRLNFYKEDAAAWEDLDIDTIDHYYIAARHTVRAYNREAEKEIVV